LFANGQKYGGAWPRERIILKLPSQPGHSSGNESAWEAFVNVFRQMRVYALIGVTGAVFFGKLFEELSESIFRKQSAKLDDSFSLWVHKRANPILDIIFRFFSLIGGIFGVTVITGITFGVLMRRKHPHAAWLVALGVGGGVLIDQILKVIFRRRRPELWPTTGTRPKSYSFPSGHSTVTFCFCGILGWLGFKFIRPPVALVGWLFLMVFCTAMVGLSRVYRGVHYMTDVLGGFLCGGFWTTLVLTGIAIFDRLKGIQNSQETF
jgi:undecaprenyl-diphosphatase